LFQNTLKVLEIFPHEDKVGEKFVENSLINAFISQKEKSVKCNLEYTKKTFTKI